MTDKSPWWGYHATFDAHDLDHNAATSAEIIKDFLRTLVDKIDMIAFGDPIVVHFGEGNKAGWTGVQLISTSNLIGHWCDGEVDEDGKTIAPSDCYFDIFSCKPFDIKIAEQHFREYFKPQRIRVNYITRQA